MFRDSTNTALSFFVLMVALIFLLSLSRVAAAQSYPRLGITELVGNSTGSFNTGIGFDALVLNNTGSFNTATGADALLTNTTGNFNTAIGTLANVSAENLTNATAIGAGAGVTASNKIRLGNTQVTVIEGQVPFTASSDKTKKENFKP